MKKRGFTLAELLVSLSIVAIASALMIPAFTNMMPDKYKLRVLRYHAMIANATNRMLENEAIYYKLDINGNDNCIGLECDAQPLVAPYNVGGLGGLLYQGNGKYINILIDMLSLERVSPLRLDYRTPDGTIWNINTEGTGNDWTTTITLTFDSKDNNNHSFDANHTSPNQFIFIINRDGDVLAGDAMTDAYLNNPTNRDKKKDKDTARDYLNDPVKNVNYLRN